MMINTQATHWLFARKDFENDAAFEVLRNCMRPNTILKYIEYNFEKFRHLYTLKDKNFKSNIVNFDR